MIRTRALPILLALGSAAPSAWAQCELELQSLEPVDGHPGDTFGYRVERKGDLAVIASTFADAVGVDSGLATAWVRENGLWRLDGTLLPADVAAGDIFAYAVAVDGEQLVVGAPGHDHPRENAGAVYVYARDKQGAWVERAHFTPPGAGPGAEFGYSLAVRGDRLLVGAPNRGMGVTGMAYLYRRDADGVGGWTLERELKSADPATGFHFGQDVTLGDHVLAVSGARRDIFPYDHTYVAHLRAEDAGGPGAWGQVQVLESPSGDRDLFAWEIGLDGDRLIAAAPAEWNPSTNQVGAVYVFRRDLGGPENWGLERRLEAAATPGELFVPDEVDLRGDWIVTGNGQSAIVFGRDVGGPGAWGEVTRIQDEDAGDEVLFGVDVALEGSELLLGASGTYAGSESGEVYVYDLERLARARWRNDAARSNPEVHRALTRPIPGTTYEAEVDLRGVPHDQAWLAAFATSAEVDLGSAGVLLGAQLVSLRMPSRIVGGRARFELALPADPALCGRRFTTQAVLLGGGAPLRLANAQDLVLGAP